MSDEKESVNTLKRFALQISFLAIGREEAKRLICAAAQEEKRHKLSGRKLKAFEKDSRREPIARGFTL